MHYRRQLISSMTIWMKYKNNYVKVGKGTIEAVIVSHSHIDHYGGLQTLKDINGGELIIYAPKGFRAACCKQNLYAGVAMGRRASQYGTRLQAGCCGRISIGIGQGQSTGTVGTCVRPMRWTKSL